MNCSLDNLETKEMCDIPKNSKVKIDPTKDAWKVEYKGAYVGHYSTREQAADALKEYVECQEAKREFDVQKDHDNRAILLQSQATEYNKAKYKDGIHEYAFNHYLVKDQGAVVEYFTSRRDAEEYIELFT